MSDNKIKDNRLLHDNETVSVVVFTFNSEKFVLQTLESVKNQDYEKIELIISDDCSTDNTVKICKNWLKNNKNRFVNSRVIEVKKNTGVGIHANRGLKHTNFDWVKFIAGDDILLPSCIKDNLSFIQKFQDVKVLFSQIYMFADSFDSDNKYKKFPSSYPNNLMDKRYTAEDQYKLLLLSDRITYTPSLFFNKNTIVSVGGFDEDFDFVEDYPMWLRLTKAGIRLYFFEKVTVAYRQHEKSLNAKSDQVLFTKQYFRMEKVHEKYVYPYLPWDIKNSMKYKYKVSKVFDQIGLNNETGLNQLFFRFISSYLNPFYYIYYLKKNYLGYKKDIFYS